MPARKTQEEREAAKQAKAAEKAAAREAAKALAKQQKDEAKAEAAERRKQNLLAGLKRPLQEVDTSGDGRGPSSSGAAAADADVVMADAEMATLDVTKDTDVDTVPAVWETELESSVAVREPPAVTASEDLWLAIEEEARRSCCHNGATAPGGNCCHNGASGPGGIC